MGAVRPMGAPREGSVCSTCGGRGWHTAGGNEPAACGRCEAGALWAGDSREGIVDKVRGWLWMTFAYERLHWPGNLVQKAWVKTRGYPLPKILQPRFTVLGTRSPDDWQIASSYWTPLGMLVQAWRFHRAGGYIRLRVR